MTRWKKVTPNKYVWLYLMIILWVLLLVELSVYSYIYQKPKVIFSILPIFIIGGLLFASAMHISKENRKLAKDLDGFIKKNHLYRLRKEKDSNNKETSVLDYYPKLYFRINNDTHELCLKARLDGSPETEKIKNMERPLEGLLKKTCIEKFEENGYLYFSFALGGGRPFRVTLNKKLPEMENGSIVFSEDIIWNWKLVPHFLLTGLTGSGKTTLAQYVILCLVDQGVKVYYCDPKNDYAMKHFIENTKSAIYASSEKEIFETVKMVEREMRERQKELDTIGIKVADFSPIYLIFDEVIAYSKIADRKELSETENRIGSIAAMGRSKSTYLGLIMQRCDVRYVDGAVRDTMCCKIAMGQQSETAYEMIFGEDFRNIKNHNKEIGSALIYRSGVDSRPREFIAPFIEC